MPQKRPEDRMKIYREFVRANFQYQRGIPPTDDEVATCLDDTKAGLFKSMDYVKTMGEFLLRWLPHYEASNRKKRAQAGAAKRWGKKV